jgi:hypothetical protein
VKLEVSTFTADTPTGLRIEAVDGPPGEFAFVLVGQSATSFLPLFNGVLCLDSPIGRYNANVANNAGNAQLDSLGTFNNWGTYSASWESLSGFQVPMDLPFSPSGQVILPGDTFAFQLWFRDLTGNPPTVSSANFSNAIVVTFR